MIWLIIFHCLVGRSFSSPPNILHPFFKVSFKSDFQTYLLNSFFFLTEELFCVCWCNLGHLLGKVILAAPFPYSQLLSCLCPATFGWCTAILIHICNVLYNVFISFKDIFSLQNNPTVLSPFYRWDHWGSQGQHIQSHASAERRNWYGDQDFWLQVKCSFWPTRATSQFLVFPKHLCSSIFVFLSPVFHLSLLAHVFKTFGHNWLS